MSEYIILKEIGKGSYGKVYLAQEKHAPESAKKLVIKEIDLRHASQKDRMASRQEALILKHIKHPNVIAYKDSFEKHNNGFLYIVMTFAEGGDLFTRIKQQRNLKRSKDSSADRKYIYLEERQVVEWSVQIAMGLQYLHSKQILHRDLKTQNIFLTKANLIKIGDLGIAKVLDTNTMNETLPASTLIGTPYYMSPEIFQNIPYSYKSDMWSFGCCIYELLTLRHAFHAKDMNSLVYAVMKKDPPTVPNGLYSPTLVDLAKRLLCRDPILRPSPQQYLKHGFIKSYIQQFLKNTQQKVAKHTDQLNNKITVQDTNSSDLSTQSNSSSKSISPESTSKYFIDDDVTVTVPKHESIASHMNFELPKIEKIKIQSNSFKNTKPVGPVTLGSTTKLLDRIVTLRKECLEKMGVVGLSQVYDIIDKFIGNDHLDLLEEKLKQHLGDSKFNEIGLKIWQLKFCEEQLFV